MACYFRTVNFSLRTVEPRNPSKNIQRHSTSLRALVESRKLFQVSIMACNLRTANTFLRTVRSFTDRTNSTDRKFSRSSRTLYMKDSMWKKQCLCRRSYHCVVLLHYFPLGKKPTHSTSTYREIFADVIVYIFAHLHRALRTEGNTLDINWLQAAKELVEFNTWWNF